MKTDILARISHAIGDGNFFVISVVIPTYNRLEFLIDAVDSVRNQSFQDWELILIDDGSTDGTGEVVEGIEDHRIRYHRQSRRGPAAARNAGIHRARHQWLAFLDSDDFWQPGKLQRQWEALRAHPGYRAVYTDEIWLRRGRRVNPRKIHRKYSGWIYHRCLPRCIISPSSILLHRRLLERYGTFDESYPVCEDYELWLRLSAREPFLFLSEPLIIKRGGHADQLSQSRWGMDRYRVRAMAKICRTGGLTPQQQRWTMAEIITKAGILAQGFENRRKPRQAAAYRRLIQECQRRLEDCIRPGPGVGKPVAARKFSAGQGGVSPP